MTPREQWAAKRTEAAAGHLARLEASLEAEHRRAEAMLKVFTRAARAAGLSPVPLRARGYRRSRSARTPLLGWYLRRDEKAAVDTDGNFYLLLTPLSLLDRFRGVTPRPSRPPLVLGAGGRDGDSVPLRVALDRLLPGWETRGA